MKDKCKNKKDGKCLVNKEICQDFYEYQKLCKQYEESDCPDRENGHRFIPCDEWPATCTCGKQEGR
jgi:hypothetical protein